MKNLKLLREEKNMSQEKLGSLFNLSQQSIYKYETQGIEPDIETLEKMADFFEVSVDFLIGHTEIRHRYEELSRFDLNAEEARLIELFRKLSADQRVHIVSTAKMLLKK